MKRNIALAAVMVGLSGVLALSGCGTGSPVDTGEQQATNGGGKAGGGPIISKGSSGIEPDELGDKADADVQQTLAELNEEYDALVAKTATFESYTQNVEAVQAYYDAVLVKTNEQCIRLRQYAIDCAQTVLKSGKTPGQMYDDLEVLYDDLYDHAGEDLYDGVYDELFGKLYDAFYNGVIKDGYDTMGYGEWSEISSAAYEAYSDAISDAYELISDCRSDIYGFSSDVRSDVFGDDMEHAEKEIARFQEDIDKLKEE